VPITSWSLGAAVLFAYGIVVNSPPWDFGRLLGVYVAMFFPAAQLINWAAFGVRPTLPIGVGGALIAAGGLAITFWRA
jgi:small multidrug resistance family-3 protein